MDGMVVLPTILLCNAMGALCCVPAHAHNLPAIDHMIQSLKNLCIVKTRAVRSGPRKISVLPPPKGDFSGPRGVGHQGRGRIIIFYPLKDINK